MIRSHAISSVCLALLASVLNPGCPAHRPPEEVDRAFGNVQAEITLGHDSFKAATGALKNLRDADSDSLRPAIAAFQKAVDDLESKAGGVDWVLGMTQSRAQQYFTDWQKKIDQIENDDLHNRAANRREQAMSQYDEVQRNIDALRVVFRPFMSKLKDINAAVSADPTITGRNAAKPLINQALDAESDIDKATDALGDSISKARGK